MSERSAAHSPGPAEPAMVPKRRRGKVIAAVAGAVVVAIVVVVVVLVVGRKSDSSGGKSYYNAQASAVASALGCSGFAAEDVSGSVGANPLSSGSCTYKATSVTVTTWRNKGDEQQGEAVTSAVGAVAGCYAHGPGWWVSSNGDDSDSGRGIAVAAGAVLGGTTVCPK